MKLLSTHRAILIALSYAAAVSPCTAQNVAPPADMVPLKPLVNTGPIQLVSASWLGGTGEDKLVSVAIDSGGNIILLGNGGPIAVPGVRTLALGGGTPPEQGGFLVAVSPDGKRFLQCARFPEGVELVKVEVAETGAIYVLGEAKAEMSLGPAKGTGSFIAVLAPDASRVQSCQFFDRATDFAFDSNGEWVVLENRKLSRYKIGSDQPVWTSNWRTHGDNRPGGIALSRKTGIAAVVGYGMTHTGREPWKNPYAYGFDRQGKQVWALWNPDPKDQVAAEHGGTGLMADTTGRFAGTTIGGDFLMALYADGGNSVVTRDPQDPRANLDPSVFQGSFQPGPGHGFKGASSTAVALRIDPQGKLLKGTWMTAWLNPQRANGLGINAAVGGDKDEVFVVGGSAHGFPSKQPWFEAPEGGYKGGGFLAAFDSGFKMMQSGYFPGTDVGCVAYRDGKIVIAGAAVAWAKGSDKSKPNSAEISYPTSVHAPIQKAFGGGKKDGWFAIFQVGS